MYITKHQLTESLREIKEQRIKRDRELLESLNDVMRQKNMTGQIAVIEKQKEFLAHVYEKASAYTNLIMVGGYAGLFAIWQFTRDFLTHTESVLVALLTLSSIIVFVGFEVYKNVSTALLLMRLGRVINQVSTADRNKAWEQAFRSHHVTQTKLWPFFLIPTVVTGFGAGIVLMVALVCDIL